jgi:nitrogen-specific signal transduction histidine kinase
LSVSVGIVKDHDGWIEIDSRPGGGTLFRVFLPAQQAV